jgi:GH15 family glucan-1,4-alpha-glucosidase
VSEELRQPVVDEVAAIDRAAVLAAQLPNGAYPASAAFSQYGHCWLRDGSFIAHAADRAGLHDSAARFHDWVGRCVTAQADTVQGLIARRHAGTPISEFEFLPARYTVEGEWQHDGWPNFQLDGYGQWLWSLANHLALTGVTEVPAQLSAAVVTVVDYLEEFWDEPCYDCWEEFRSQLHTATLASISAGMTAIASYLPPEVAARAAATGDAARDVVLTECVVDGHFVKHIGNEEVDASLVWLATPFGLVAEDDPVLLATVAKIERDLVVDHGTSRYRADTYYGGGEWPLLSASLAWFHARGGRPDDAFAYLDWIEGRRLRDGSLPEQVPRLHHNARFLEHWTRNWGASASPLVWSHAMALVARLELSR